MSGDFFIKTVFAFASIVKTCPVIRILFFPNIKQLFLFTVVFGIVMKVVNAVPCQLIMQNSGKRNLLLISNEIILFMKH